MLPRRQCYGGVRKERFDCLNIRKLAENLRRHAFLGHVFLFRLMRSGFLFIPVGQSVSNCIMGPVSIFVPFLTRILSCTSRWPCPSSLHALSSFASIPLNAVNLQIKPNSFYQIQQSAKSEPCLAMSIACSSNIESSLLLLVKNVTWRDILVLSRSYLYVYKFGVCAYKFSFSQNIFFEEIDYIKLSVVTKLAKLLRTSIVWCYHSKVTRSDTFFWCNFLFSYFTKWNLASVLNEFWGLLGMNVNKVNLVVMGLILTEPHTGETHVLFFLLLLVQVLVLLLVRVWVLLLLPLSVLFLVPLSVLF